MKIVPQVTEKYPKLLMAMEFAARQPEEGFGLWESSMSKCLTIVDAETDKLTWEFQVEREHCNALNNLHGGCVATLIDTCSSIALLVASGKQWKSVGISTDLSVSYLRGVPKGETIRLVCEVQRVGRTLASLYTKIYDAQNRLCYAGSHTKFNIDSKL